MRAWKVSVDLRDCVGLAGRNFASPNWGFHKRDRDCSRYFLWAATGGGNQGLRRRHSDRDAFLQAG